MNFKTTLSLVALLALVLGYFYFFERDAAPPADDAATDTTQRQAGEAFWADELKADDVTAITIERGGAPIKIEKVDGQWMETAPVRFPLNDYRPKQVIDGAAALTFVGKFTPGEGEQPSLADVALDQPRATVTLTTKDGSRTIKLGKTSSGSRGYAMLPDDGAVYVVNDALHQAVLTGQPSDWRKRSFEAPTVEQLERVVLQRSGPTGGTHTAQKIDGKWYLDEAATQRLSEEKVRSLVQDVGGFYISEFVADAQPEKLSIYGLAEPRVEVTLAKAAVGAPAAVEPASTQASEGGEGKTEESAKPQAAASAGGERVTLRVGAPADLKEEQFYATWSTTDEPSRVVFTVSKSSVDQVTKPIDDLRDPRIAIYDPTRVREMRIERREGGNLVLQRVEGGYVFGEPTVDFKPDTDGVRAIIGKPSEVKATAYEPAPQTTEAPAAAVTLFVDGVARPEKFTLFGPRQAAGKAQYVSVREGESLGYVVDAAQLEGLFQPAVALRDKTILDVPADALASITVKQPDGYEAKLTKAASGEAASEGQSADAAKPQAAWTLDGATTYEQAAVDALLAGVAPLRVEAWEATASPINPNATLTLNLADGTTHVLGIETSTRRGRLQGLEPTFTLPQPLLDAVTAEFRDRVALPLSLSDLDSVTLRRGEQSVLIRRNADGTYVGAEDAPMDAAKAAGVFDTLAGLRVERYVAAPASPAAEPELVLEIAARAGNHRLTLRPDSRVGTLDGERYFTLPQADVQKLLDGLTAPQPKQPAPPMQIPGMPSFDDMNK